MMRCIFFFLMMLLLYSLAAQPSKPDSLRQALKFAKSDSAAYATSFALSNYYLEKIRDSSLYYLEKCIDLAQKNNKPLNEASAIAQKAYLHYHLNKFGESYKYIAEAFAIAQDPESEMNLWLSGKKFTPQTFRLTTLAGLHMLTYIIKININKANTDLSDLQEARKIYLATTDSIKMSETYKLEAFSYLQQNKLDQANAAIEKAISFIDTLKTTYFLSEVFLIRGTIAVQKGNYGSAIENMHKGLYWAYDDNDLDDVGKCYAILTDVYSNKLVKKDSAIYYAMRQMEVLKGMNSGRLDQAYINVYKSFKLNNEKDSAYKYLQLGLKAQEDFYEKSLKSMSDFQNLSFQEKVQLQNLEREKILTQSKIRTYALMAGLTVFLFIGLLLYRNSLQKQKANKNLQTTLNNLKSTQAQLIQSEKMASLGELTAGIAHEIQNPLNFVNNFSEINTELLVELKEEIKKGNLEEVNAIADDVISNEEKINHHGKRADAIVKGMLQHSRSSSGQTEPTDINALADEYLRLAYHGLRAKDKSFNATMKTDFDETIGNINIIPQDIGRVLLNLINNAFYAVNNRSTKGEPNYIPTVSITTKQTANSQLLIAIQDNGDGIPESIKEKIFQPFFTTKPTGQGTGLGLSLSYDIVKAHGGELKVETKEGECSTFIIELPVV